jgi:hypothetical protein
MALTALAKFKCGLSAHRCAVAQYRCKPHRFTVKFWVLSAARARAAAADAQRRGAAHAKCGISYI